MGIDDVKTDDTEMDGRFANYRKRKSTVNRTSAFLSRCNGNDV